MVYIFLADGFEIIEALSPADMLSRAGIDYKLVGVTGEYVTSSAGIVVKSDITINDVEVGKSDMIILPGGLPGTTNLEKDSKVISCAKAAYDSGKFVCAICAAPSILGHLGMLEGIKATCYPSFESELVGATYTGSKVERVGNVITARGAGVAVDFGLECVSALVGADVAQKISNSIQK